MKALRVVATAGLVALALTACTTVDRGAYPNCRSHGQAMAGYRPWEQRFSISPDLGT